MIANVWFLVVACACIFFVAFFAGIETGIISVNSIRIKHLAGKKNIFAIAVDNFLKNINQILATTLVGTNLFVVIASSSFSLFIYHKFGCGKEWIATLLLTPVVLVFGEIIPKNIFRARPQVLTMFFSYLLVVFVKIFYPAVIVVNAIARFIILRVFKLQVTGRSLFVNREELKYMIEESEKAGVIESTKRKMVHHIFDFSKKNISDLMVGIKDVVSVDVSSTIDKCALVCMKSGFMRVPVFEEKSDNIIGFVNVFDILYEDTKDISLKDIVRPVYYVKEDMFVDNVFFTMRRRRFQVAVVINKFNKAVGIVTTADLLDAVIGES